MHGYPYNSQPWGWTQDSSRQAPQQDQYPMYHDPLSNVNRPSVVHLFGARRLNAMPSVKSSYGSRSQSITRRHSSLKRPPPPETSSKIPHVLAFVFLLLIVASVVLAIFLTKQEGETVDGWLTLTNVDVQSSQFTDFQQGFCSELELATTVHFVSCKIIKTSVLGELTFRIATGDNEKATEDIEAAVMQQLLFTGQQILHNNVDFSSETIQCSTSSCENGGVCYDTIASFQCECSTGFSGETCDQDSMQCATSPCLHGSTCLELAVLYSCTCAPSYTGTNCETETGIVEGWINVPTWTFNDNLLDPTSAEFMSKKNEICDDLDTVSPVPVFSCDMIFENPLLPPTARVRRSNDGVRANFTLVVASNSTSYDDILTTLDYSTLPNIPEDGNNVVIFGAGDTECANYGCLNQATCVYQRHFGNYSCECTSGYAGVKCETDVDECLVGPCQNNATCQEGIGTFTCTCAVGFTGQLCDMETGIVEGWINVPTWTFNDNLLDPTSAELMAKQNEICYDLNTVSPVPVVSCDMIFESNDGVRANFTLLVVPSNSSFPDILTTMDYTVLPNIPVDENRVVIIGAGDTECANYGCLNQATCVYQRPFGNYSCDCTNGYAGVKCETDVDECLVGPCQNNATCQEGIGTYTCTCAVGFTGQLCDVDIDDCVTSPCMNGGTCVDQINNYTCTCPAVTLGSNCETVITCDGFVCQNLGTCMVDSGTGVRRCDCHTNYMGDNCEISPLIAYGVANGDTAITLTQGNALDLTLTLGTLPMFGLASMDLKVRDNGYLVTTAPPEVDCNSNPSTFDFYPIIAPLQQQNNPDVGSPMFFYRETVDVDIRTQVTAEVCAFMTYNSQTCDFNATYVVIITFEKMEPDELGATGVNTYQVILATDTMQTYALYVYGIILRTGTTCPTMVGYTGLDSADNDVVDLDAIGGFANLVTTSNYGKQPNYIFYLGQMETGIVEGWINVPIWTFNDNLLDPTSAEFMAKKNEICDDLNTVSPVPVISCDMIFESTDGVRANFTLLVASNNNSFDDIFTTMDYTVLPNIPEDENRVVIIGAGDAGCANYGCLNQATCVYQRPFGNYSCDCINGYTGAKCETDVDECLVGPCQNNATCQEGIATFTCTCAVGFTGRLCDVDIDDCVTSPCMNDGTCVDQINNYTCTCPVITMGRNCETVITCDGFVCQNLGTCMVDSETGARRCDCHPNYMGDYCEISPLIAYGVANGDTTITLTQNNAVDLTLSQGTLPMFGQTSVDLKVRDNGYLMTTAPPEVDCNSNSATFDFYPIIAPLHQQNNPDVGSPMFFYRETVDVDICAQVTAEVCAFMTFNNQTCDFNATYVVIITFENMEPDEVGATGVNTFQVILATDRRQTYALYVYGIILRTGTTCPTMVGYTGVDSADEDVVDLTIIGGFENLVTSSNYGKQPNYIFYLGQRGALVIYGDEAGTTQEQLDVQIDENSDVTAAFDSDFTYFGTPYSEVHISSNGYVVFGTKPASDVAGDGLPPCADITFAGFGPAIAVFSTDLANVNVVYRQVTESSQLLDITNDICLFLGGTCTFSATWAFVITWDQARASDNPQGPSVTAQLILVSDGASSYGIRAYGDIGFFATTCGGSPGKVIFTGVGYTDGVTGDTNEFIDIFHNAPNFFSIFSETNVQIEGRWVMSFNIL